MGRDGAVGKRERTVGRQLLAVVSAEIIARRRLGECVVVVARQRAIDGVRLLGTVGLAVDGVDGQVASLGSWTRMTMAHVLLLPHSSLAV